MQSYFHKYCLSVTVLTILAFTATGDILSSTFDSDGGDYDFQQVYLLSPLAGEQLPADTIQRISWQSGSKIQYITIEYSVNNGQDWIEIVKSRKVDAPFGDYRWQVPCSLSDNVKIRISDAYGPYDDENLGVFSIVDRTPPAIKISLGRDSIWPPDNNMIDVGFSYAIVDNCDPDPRVFIKVSSDEPALTVSSASASKNAPDAEIMEGNRVLLRAERSEQGDGRVYVLTVTATDAFGNSSAAIAAVKVNLTREKEAVDSGQSYDPTLRTY